MIAVFSLLFSCINNKNKSLDDKEKISNIPLSEVRDSEKKNNNLQIQPEESSPSIKKLIYFDKGNEREILLDIDNQNKVLSKIISLIDNYDNTLRMPVYDEQIKSVKNGDKGLDILISRNLPFKFGMNKEKEFVFNRIILPFEIEYSSSDRTSITIFIAKDNDYYTTPLVNSKGYKNLAEIKQILNL